MRSTKVALKHFFRFNLAGTRSSPTPWLCCAQANRARRNPTGMLSGCAMSVLDRFKSRFPGPAAALETRIAIVRKAVSFALVGVVNTIVDAGVFFLAYAYLTSRPALGQVLSSFAAACGCASAATVTLVAANVFSW